MHGDCITSSPLHHHCIPLLRCCSSVPLVPQDNFAQVIGREEIAGNIRLHTADAHRHSSIYLDADISTHAVCV